MTETMSCRPSMMVLSIRGWCSEDEVDDALSPPPLLGPLRVACSHLLVVWRESIWALLNIVDT